MPALATLDPAAPAETEHVPPPDPVVAPSGRDLDAHAPAAHGHGARPGQQVQDQERVPRLRRGKAELLEWTTDRLAIVLVLVVPFLAAWALRSFVAWQWPALVVASIAIGVAAALVPIFAAAYLVERRRRLRALHAEMVALYPAGITARKR